MKVITMCGSLKFKDDLMYWAEKLELQGNCVLTPIFNPKSDKDAFTPAEINLLGIMHKKKIDLSDAIFVINRGGYIGDATRGEIEYAMARGKEILFMES